MRVELRGLTGIRAFAAAGVVFFHLIAQYPTMAPDAAPIRGLTFGSNGVDLFFTLSGFIIAYTYAHDFQTFSFPIYLAFLRKRLARIYPAHLFALVLVIGLAVLLSLRGFDFLKNNPVSGLVQQLFLVSAWNPSHKTHLDWNVPDWSISSEWLAYLLFPLILAVIRLIPGRILPALILVLPVLMASAAEFEHINAYMVRILTEFPCGVALYFLWLNLRPTKVWATVGLVCAVLYVVLGVIFGLIGVDVRWVVVFVPPLLISIALNAGPVAAFLGRPLVEYLGRVSYSLYITHYPVLVALNFLFRIPRIRDNLTLTLICTLFEVAAIYAMARFTYHFVEEPARKWLTRSAVRRPSTIE